MTAPVSNSRGVVAASFVSALLFGAGLIVSGMTTPMKVVGFLDPLGPWDPSLAFVMIGAIGVHAILYRLARRRASPLFAGTFAVPTRRDIDPRLVLGAVLFGAGWALAGVCPGPGLVAMPAGIAGGAWSVLVFIAAMFAGMKLFSVWDQRSKS